jgi:hypothetical protein
VHGYGSFKIDNFTNSPHSSACCSYQKRKPSNPGIVSQISGYTDVGEHQTDKYFQYTGHTQKNDAVSTVNSFETAPFFCVYPVFRH